MSPASALGQSGGDRAKVLELLLKRRGLEVPRAPSIPPRSGEGPWALSFGQERLWFLDRLEPGGASYNLPTASRLVGPFDPATWSRAVGEVVRRHESLRTRFPSAGGEPVQEIDPPGEILPWLVDLRNLPEPARTAEARRLVEEEARRPFDLAAGPLFRTGLLRSGEDEHTVLVTMHHIVSDGWSLEIFVAEAAALYQGFRQGIPPRLAPLPIQYADFAFWQRGWLQGEVLERELDHWRRRLAGAPAEFTLPLDHPRAAVQSSRGAALRIHLGRDLSGRLRHLGQCHGVTLFVTLATGFAALLARCSGQHDTVLGTPVAGRGRPEVQDLIGFFVNTQVLRLDLSDDPSFSEALERAREIALDLQAHQDLPFEKLVAELSPERRLTRSPLFQVMFALRRTSGRRSALPGLRILPLDASTGTSPFDLTLTLQDGEAELSGTLEYSQDLFDAPSIRRFAGRLETFLRELAGRPGLPASAHELMPAGERQQVLLEWNAAAGPPPEADTLPALFERQVALRPDTAAVVGPEETLSYAELNRRAHRLTRRLSRLGVGPEVPVGIFLDRSVELIVALLGTLRAGGFYVPIDPGYSWERLGFVLEDARIPVLLTQERFRDAVPPGLQAVFLDAPGEEREEGTGGALPTGPDGSHLAYLMYTSGSTGTPKGVAITHRSVANFCRAASRSYRIAAGDRLLQFASPGFDTSVEEIFTALTEGATLVLRTESMMTSVAGFLEACDRHGITVLDLPTAYWHTLVAELEPGGLPERVRLVIIGGERALADRLETWTSRVERRVRLVNGYGPTETTVVATWCALTDRPDVWLGRRPIPIGRALPGLRVYLLDRAFQPAVPGAPGELCAGGEGVARGYLGRPDLTAERFIPDPFSRSGERLYRTGDLARWHPSGDLEYLGRTDDQVKIRGFRIEPGEVEAALGRHPAVAGAVVLAREDGAESRLVAYVATGQERVGEGELREHLSGLLPPFMVPASFVLLDALPLTSNGKVDRRALGALEPGARPAALSAPPRDVLELHLIQLWEDLLGIRGIGVRDDFFALGGHSLAAVRLMNRLRQSMGRDLPLATLFQASTVESFARVLRQQEAPPRSSLVAIRSSGHRPPFFCVHPVGGHVFRYLDLARRLGAEQPFYGFQTPPPGPGAPREAGIGDLADLYLLELCKISPQGPYFLGGWSMGGAVAYEMACRLEARGERVALLALLDARVPEAGQAPVEDEMSLLTTFARDLGLAPGDGGLTLSGLRELPADERLGKVLEEAKRKDLLHPDIEAGEIQLLFEVFRANLKAFERWTPASWGGRVTLFRPEAEEVAYAGRPDAGWGRLARGGVEVVSVPGDHFGMVREPAVGALAGKLGALISTAGKEAG